MKIPFVITRKKLLNLSRDKFLHGGPRLNTQVIISNRYSIYRYISIIIYERLMYGSRDSCDSTNLSETKLNMIYDNYIDR